MSEWQWVISAMWDTQGDKDGKPTLVAAWVFSPGGDETNLLHLESYASDVFEFHEAAKIEKSIPMPSCCNADSVFSCSSGDCPIDDDDFQCPALSGFDNVEDLERESSRKTEALAWDREIHRRAPLYYEEDPTEYSSDEEEDDEDDEDDEDNASQEESLNIQNHVVFDFQPPKPSPPRELPPSTSDGTFFVAPASFTWGSSANPRTPARRTPARQKPSAND